MLTEGRLLRGLVLKSGIRRDCVRVEGVPRGWHKLDREVTWFVVFTVNSKERWHGHGMQHALKKIKIHTNGS